MNEEVAENGATEKVEEAEEPDPAMILDKEELKPEPVGSETTSRESLPGSTTASSAQRDKKGQLLIVEDNPEIRNFICSELENEYHLNCHRYNCRLYDSLQDLWSVARAQDL